MPFEIVRADITKMETDAIVNAANSALQMGGGVCGAIFTAAGARALQQACNGLGGCETGQAVITKGYNLPAKYIIHAVGPIWRGGGFGEAALLDACYTNSLKLAKEHGLSSIAFPLISSGIYGYPKDQALQIAVTAIGKFLLEHEMDVSLVVFDKNAYMLGEALYSSIQAFIDERYVEEHTPLSRFPALRQEEADLLGAYETAPMPAMAVPPQASEQAKRHLEDIVGQLEESFSQMLLRLIDEKGMTDVATYKRANIDRKLFSKIRTGKGYNPGKTTALALAVALRLNLDETRDLLAKAGYALSRSHKMDVIVEFFIREGNYDIFTINEALFAFDQPLLGGPR